MSSGWHFTRSVRPLADRLWEKVDRSGGPAACWPWTGTTANDGYGLISLGRKAEGSRVPHRVAWELTNGPIPDEGLTLDHLCRNHSCCNPVHLEPVTIRENNLRGDGFAAQNARKTHCLQGHPYDEANTYRTRAGSRQCRLCSRLRTARYRAR